MVNVQKNQENENLHKCEFCLKCFVKAETLITHSCLKKKRWEDRDTRISVIAYNAYVKVLTFISPSKKKTSFREFIDSSYYLALIKYARFAMDNEIISPSAYLDYLLIKQIKMQDWNLNIHYNKYILDYVKLESYTKALERGIRLMSRWSDETNKQWDTFFSEVSTFRATAWILSGQLSPWLIHVCPSADKLIGRMLDEQLNIIIKIVDPDYWNFKINNTPEGKEYILDILKGTLLC